MILAEIITIIYYQLLLLLLFNPIITYAIMKVTSTFPEMDTASKFQPAKGGLRYISGIPNI